MPLVSPRSHPRPARVLLGAALLTLSAAAPAALVTVDFTDRTGNSLTSFTKTVGGVTLSFSNPFHNGSLSYFSVDSSGLSLSPSADTSFAVSFDRAADLISYTGSFNGPPSPAVGFTISGPGVSSANTMSAAGDFTGQPLAVSANQTYQFTLTGQGELHFATWAFEPGEATVPIPATPLLMAAGLAGLVGRGRWRGRRR